MTSKTPRMRLADLPRVLLDMGPAAGRAVPTGAAVRSWCSAWSGGGVALIVLCLAVYLPGLWSIPPVDRDESRFAQASRTMLESGDYVVPRIGSTPRLNKPPLIYWLQAASARVLGDGPGADGMGEWGNGNIWVYRVPSVLCAIGTVLLTWRMGVRMFDARAGALGAALLAVSPMVIWDAHQARADQLLLCTTTGAMFALYVCWRGAIRSGGMALSARPPVGWVLSFWVSMGLGILAKGPITPMIAVLAAIALSVASRNVRWLYKLRPVVGLLIVAAIVGPWVYLVAQRVGWQTYWTTVYDETLGRSTEAKESHWGPPGYHLVLLTVLFWPGSLLTAAAVVRSWKRGFARFALGNRPEGFLLAWVIPAWVVFEIVATKLPHYTMPMYPAIALLSARAVLAFVGSAVPAAKSVGFRLGAIAWAAIGVVGLGFGLIFIMYKGLGPGRWQNLSTFGIAFLGMCFLGTLVCALARDILHRKVGYGLIGGMIAMVVWAWAALGWVIPYSNGFWTSAFSARAIERVSKQSSVALVDYQEDSLVFLLRGRCERVSEPAMSAWLSQHASGVVVVTDRSPTEAAVLAEGSREQVFRFDGYNYSNGKPAQVRIYSTKKD